ncbi:MAG: hypothetical protein OXR68_06370 [Alphaproteobacteria bacterium]|nr:hypothetical protein [Alphaproteobacteria bacterium]MDD9920230.1 hypothetical protein [Alphaproteobacteria bacterium]
MGTIELLDQPFTQSKRGPYSYEKNEDGFAAVYESGKLVLFAVIDGAAVKPMGDGAKAVEFPNGWSAGRFAMETTKEALKQFVKLSNWRMQALEPFLATRLYEANWEAGVYGNGCLANTPTASAVILLDTGVIHRFGDCRVMVDGELYPSGKRYDGLTVGIRCAVTNLTENANMPFLPKDDDFGRQVISDLLRMQSGFSNVYFGKGQPLPEWSDEFIGILNQISPKMLPEKVLNLLKSKDYVTLFNLLAHDVLNGTPIPPQLLQQPILLGRGKHKIIMTSDGFEPPFIFPNIEESIQNQHHYDVKVDPNRLGEHKATSAVQKGWSTRDDCTHSGVVEIIV